jgi:hypothetical protein
MYLSSWRERHGETAFRRAAEVLTKQVGSPRLGFSSPARALAWYDWMTFGRYFIYGAVGLTIACTPFHLYEINRPEISGVPIMLVCGFAGVFLAYRLYYGDSKDNDAYLVTLPVSVERLSKLRLITITKFVATAAVIAILLEACIMLGVYPFSEPLGAPQASLWILLAPLCGWMLIWLTGPLFYPVIAGWLLAIVIAGFLKWFFLPQVPFEEIAGFTGGGIACVFALVATVWLVRAAKRRGLLFKWNKRLAVAAWLVATVITVPVFLEEFHGDATAAMFIIPLFLCLLPATPFIALPLAIDRYRHR